MSEIKKINVRIVRKVDVTASLISSVSAGNLDKVKKLVHSHGLSHCECGNGGYVPLFVAIKLDHIEIAKFLLQEGARTDCGTDNVITPLHLATEEGNVELVQLLLEKNALVDVRTEEYETPLHFAAKEGYADIVEVLLSNGASVTTQTSTGLTPLFLAVAGKHAKVVRMLLEHAHTKLEASAKPRDSTFLDHILPCNPSVQENVNELVVCIVIHDDGGSEIVNDLIDHGFILSREHVNEAVLLAAVKKNHVKFINSVLRSGANPSDAKHNPLLLHTAVKNGREEIIELFLNSGFDANAKDKEGKTCLCYSLNCCEKDKYVRIIQLLLSGGANVKEAPEFLHIATSEGLMEVCALLIKGGADINARNTHGETPLFLAVSKYGSHYASLLERKKRIDDSIRYNIVRLLLYSGADVKIHKYGCTIFHDVIKTGRKELVSMFLDFGVDVDLPAEHGLTPIYVACQRNYLEIVEDLCKNDANLSRHQRVEPLYFAVLNWNVKVVDTLLKFGADIGFQVNDVIDDSDDSDYDDNYNCVLRILKKHILKLKAAGLDVSQPNLHLNYRSFSDFKRECKKEVNTLKNEQVHHHFTLYDILVDGKMPAYAKNKSLMEVLQSFNFDRFPIYKNLIKNNLEISKFRLKLLQSGQRSLDILVKTSNKLNRAKCSVLPIEILEEIVSYLTYSEVKNLICCSKVLKFQISQY